jgi:uncharacterized protein YukE
MAGSGWGFTQGEMTQAVKAFEGCANGIRSTMSKLEGELEAAIHGKMAGQHLDALVRLHTRIQEDMTKINSAMNEMSSRMDATKNKYNVADATAGGLYAKLIG